MVADRGSERLNLIRVADATDPRLEHYRNQKDAWLRAQRKGGTGIGEGLFLAEGELVARALVESGHETVSVLCTPERLAAIEDALAGLPEGTSVFVAQRPALERIVGFDLHRGILALGRRRERPAAADLIRRARALVVCEDLSNHDNLGAIFRNAACLLGAPSGAALPAAVLLSPRCCDPLYRKSLRVSMGHALRVPFATLGPWPDALRTISEAGFALLALTPHPGAMPIREYELPPNTRPAVLLGSEGEGLSRAAMAHARPIRIPMAPGADSLNVATALAVALSHLRAPDPQAGEPPGGAPSP